MSTLNRLPNGMPSPSYKCTAIGRACGETKTVVLQEWWYEDRQVQTIEQSAEEYFYGDGTHGFDKHPFKILNIEEID
jgi:hypothetical protein